MGELQHLGGQRRRAGDERRLGARLHVAGEQHAPTPPRGERHTQHERAVVRAPVLRADARRPEHLEEQIAHLQRGIAERGLLHDCPAAGGRCHQRCEGRTGGAAGWQPDAFDRQLGQHRREPAAMVQIGVTGYHQIELRDAERA